MAATVVPSRTEKVARSQITMVRSMYHALSENKDVTHSVFLKDLWPSASGHTQH